MLKPPRIALIAAVTPLMIVACVGPAAASPLTLRDGSPREAGFIAAHLGQLKPDTRQGMGVQSYGYPAYPGSAVLAARNGIVAVSYASGYAVRYASATAELPRREWIKVKRNTIYDLASLTKTFTAMAAVQQLAKGRLHLDTPAAHYIPGFSANGKGAITIRMLITHTSGLPPDPVPALWDPIYANNAQRWAAMYATVPLAPPGTQYLYSDVNYLILGKVIETVTGKGLSTVIREGITGPLGMTDTMFNPPAGLRHRIAQTEWQEPPLEPARGMVWGQVDDENAWALGGVAGHAGLFSTTHDLAIYCQTILNGGAYGITRILPKSWAKRAFFRDFNQGFPGDGHSLIMQINQYPRYFGAMDSERTIGHTGFTGTSLVINPYSQSFNVFLANRVDPTRAWTPRPTPNPQRRAVGDDVARAIAVTPKSGKFSWFSGMRNNPLNDQVDTTPATLTVPVRRRGGTAKLTFNLWYQLIPPQGGPPAESASLQSSSDGGRTWQPLPFSTRLHGRTREFPDGVFTGLSDRGWAAASAALPLPAEASTTPVLLRWEYTNQAVWQGRGVYVNHIQATEGQHTIFDDSRRRDANRVTITGGFRRSAN